MNNKISSMMHYIWKDSELCNNNVVIKVTCQCLHEQIHICIVYLISLFHAQIFSRKASLWLECQETIGQVSFHWCHIPKTHRRYRLVSKRDMSFVVWKWLKVSLKYFQDCFRKYFERSTLIPMSVCISPTHVYWRHKTHIWLSSAIKLGV
jgi:hypothetical protein